MKWLSSLAALGILSHSFVCVPAFSKQNRQNQPSPQNQRNQQKDGGFPGTGSFDAWKTSIPEYQAGLRSMKNSSWDEGIGHFKASLDLYAFQPKCWIEIGRAMEARGSDVTDAENAYREAIKLDSQNWHAWKRLANVLLIQKRYRAAREAAANAVALNPPAPALSEIDKIIQSINSGEKSVNSSD